MKYRTIIVYWVLVLVPTLMVGVGAFRLLRHERERLAAREAEALEQRVRAVADDVALAVTDVQDRLLNDLAAVDRDDPVPALEAWQDENPLLRQALVWRREQGLIHPRPGADASSEAGRFARRFAPLLDGRVPWETTAPDVTAAPASRGRADRVRQQREALKAMPGAVSRDAAPAPPRQAGWMPWFEDNALCLLGWLSWDGGRTVIGIELERTALLSRLVTLFPPPAPDITLALLDDRGRIVHQSGPVTPDDATPEAAVGLAPVLPHWQIAAFAGAGEAVSAGMRSLVLVSALLVATFTGAIVIGGALLTWQALRYARDARRKTSFVSNVSHELKTPLTSIRMYAELLNEKRVADPARQSRYLDVITSEAQRLTRLVNNMLDFSRLEQGRKTYRPEPLDLVEVVRGLAEVHGLRIRNAGMTLDLRLPGDPVTATADRDAVEQCVLNLIDNAIKYAARGGALTLALHRRDGRAVIEVADRGPGIPSSQREAVFRHFTRGDDSLTAEQPGSGLGLSIARSLARGLGGDVTFRPREGGGSQFEVIL